MTRENAIFTARSHISQPLSFKGRLLLQGMQCGIRKRCHFSYTILNPDEGGQRISNVNYGNSFRVNNRTGTLWLKIGLRGIGSENSVRTSMKSSAIVASMQREKSGGKTSSWCERESTCTYWKAAICQWAQMRMCNRWCKISAFLRIKTFLQGLHQRSVAFGVVLVFLFSCFLVFLFSSETLEASFQATCFVSMAFKMSPNASSHGKRLIDHVLCQHRFKSSVSAVLVIAPPVSSDHKALVADLKIRWRCETKKSEVKQSCDALAFDREARQRMDHCFSEEWKRCNKSYDEFCKCIAVATANANVCVEMSSTVPPWRNADHIAASQLVEESTGVPERTLVDEVLRSVE